MLCYCMSSSGIYKVSFTVFTEFKSPRSIFVEVAAFCPIPIVLPEYLFRSSWPTGIKEKSTRPINPAMTPSKAPAVVFSSLEASLVFHPSLSICSIGASMAPEDLATLLTLDLAFLKESTEMSSSSSSSMLVSLSSGEAAPMELCIDPAPALTRFSSTSPSSLSFIAVSPLSSRSLSSRAAISSSSLEANRFVGLNAGNRRPLNADSVEYLGPW
mmetsp:Transcript_30131/g.69086  ORF Transcript_30131/g.69086 Transcript_30131/m.69086 type:complete len:214 (-) Transcript_30131:177-818(-)